MLWHPENYHMATDAEIGRLIWLGLIRFHDRGGYYVTPKGEIWRNLD